MAEAPEPRSKGASLLMGSGPPVGYLAIHPTCQLQYTEDIGSLMTGPSSLRLISQDDRENFLLSLDHNLMTLPSNLDYPTEARSTWPCLVTQS
jgi:hypothetical protein